MLCLDHRDQRHSNLLPWCDDDGKLKMIAASLGMDYYQGVVANFLDADPAVFINNEYYIRLDGLPAKGNSWYCDIMAVNMKEQAVYLCEVTFSKSLGGLAKRLQAWDENWPQICQAIRQKSAIPSSWIIQPWLFIPEQPKQALLAKLGSIQMPQPRLTWLESVVPWNYNSDERFKDWLEPLTEPDSCS